MARHEWLTLPEAMIISRSQHVSADEVDHQ